MLHLRKIALIALGLGLADGALAQTGTSAQASSQIRVTIPDLAGWREAAARGMPVELATHASTTLIRLEGQEQAPAVLHLVHESSLPVHVRYNDDQHDDRLIRASSVSSLSPNLIEQSLVLPAQSGGHMLPRVVVFMD